MTSVGGTGASIFREAAFFDRSDETPAIDPSVSEFADTGIVESRNFPEIHCVRHWLAANVLADAEDKAAAAGVGADRVLITSGALSEETYLRVLGTTLGVKFEPLDAVPREQCPVNNERLIESASV